MQAKVSVVIPVYNTKEFLPTCINSVLSQTYQNIEILLVDDSSTDGSGELCDHYATNMDVISQRQILALHKPNGGVADARNYGMAHATGKYLLFLDSDDYYLSDTAIATLMYTAEDINCDVLCFNYTRCKNHAPERNFNQLISTDTQALVLSNIYTSSACLKLMRTDMLKELDLSFTKGQASEDILFSGELLADDTRSIAFLNEVIYFYRVRKTSITNTLKLKNITDLISILHTLESRAGVNSNTPIAPIDVHAKNLLAYAAFQYATLLINMHLCAEPLPVAQRQEIFSMRYLLQYNPTGIVKIIRLCASVLGIRATAHLMAIAFQLKQVLFQ